MVNAFVIRKIAPQDRESQKDAHKKRVGEKGKI